MAHICLFSPYSIAQAQPSSLPCTSNIESERRRDETATTLHRIPQITVAFIRTMAMRVQAELSLVPIEGVERLEKYRPGGYCPMVTGEQISDRAQARPRNISTVWLARDKQQKSYVAVKVSTAYSPSCEAGVLRAIEESPCVTDSPGRTLLPLLHDEFSIRSSAGSHKCYITSAVRCSVAATKLTSFFNIKVARALLSPLALVVAYIHAQGAAHGVGPVICVDLTIHLGNVLLRLPSHLNRLSIKQLYKNFGNPLLIWLGRKAKEITPSKVHLMLSDFGEQCQSPLLVLPQEAHHQPDKPISFPADIWTLACALLEVFSSRTDATLATRDYIAAQPVAVLGSLPAEWWSSWQARGEYFDEDDRPADRRFVFPSLEETFEMDVQASRRGSNLGKLGMEEKEAFLGMLRQMLCLQTRETRYDIRYSWVSVDERVGLPSVERIGKS
ncbi:hypothetical protein BJX68DRAFT_256927 [Aspergillus pseudodeflectus]|uniref:Protein kinase domain-containing protein n=1 Tax=Aspergillus pseudodeflectus TaxID=176178 RepID=A0ABR4JYP1_9EURO